MKFGAKRDPPASTVGFFFVPNFIQNLYTVLKKRLWESRITPTLAPWHFRPAWPRYVGPFFLQKRCDVLDAFLGAFST
jgi:hypothetical protein